MKTQHDTRRDTITSDRSSLLGEPRLVKSRRLYKLLESSRPVSAQKKNGFHLPKNIYEVRMHCKFELEKIEINTRSILT